MIQGQDIVVFQGRGDERLALGQSISHPDKVKLDRRKGGYAISIDIPWSALGEDAGRFKGGLRRADAGVLFGDDSGTRVMRRQYLFDEGSQEVSDMPSEARVNPSAWGVWEF